MRSHSNTTGRETHMGQGLHRHAARHHHTRLAGAGDPHGGSTAPVRGRALAARSWRRTVGQALLLSTVSAAVLASLSVPQRARAQDAAASPSSAEARDYRISAGPLEATLTAFAQQSGVMLSYAAAEVAGRQGPGLSGRHAVPAALDALLAGTGLAARLQPNGGYTLEPGAAAVSGGEAGDTAGAGTTLPTVKVSAALEATTEGSGSYAAEAVTVGKSTQRLREIPQSVTVMSHDRIADQGLLTLSDVLRQTAGVTQNDGLYRSNYSARGMTINTMRFEGGGASRFHSGEMDMAIYDHVSVLRGADGLFGAGDAGGVVNLSLKRPRAESGASVAATLGSWDFKRLEADLTGPVAADGAVRGRLVAVYQDRDRFYEPSHHERSLVYGAVEADLGPGTVFFAGLSHQTDKQIGIHNGLPRYADGRDLKLPRRQGVGLPWGTNRRETSEAVAQLAHRFSPDWMLKGNLRYIYESQVWRLGTLYGPVDPQTRLARWSASGEDAPAHDLNVDLNLNGAFEAWGRRHDLLVGVDFGRKRDNWGSGGYGLGDAAETDIFDPVAPRQDGIVRNAWGYGGSRYDDRGAYASLRLRATEALSLIAGTRYVIEYRNHGYNGEGEATYRVSERDHIVPYFGAIYDIGRSLSVYASTAEIYQSQATSLAGPPPGRPLDPVTGRNYEIGIKGDWSRGLTASAALYRVEKRGQAVADPAYPATIPGSLGSACCYIADGYLESQGVDLELNGELLPNWQLSLGYTFNSNHNRRANDVQFSTRTPKHLFKAWTDYRFANRLSGLRLGGGVVAQSSHFQSGSVNTYDPATDRYTGPSIDYRFVQAGYAVWSLSAHYAFNPRWSAQLNLNNVFDKRYYNTVGSTSSGNYYGDPRNLMVTLRADY